MPDVDWLRAFCLSFPDVTEDMPWPESLCFKIRGKIFAGAALEDGRFPRVTLKASPEKFHELLEIDGITPAPYVGRYKWIQIAHSDLLPTSELESLIRQSYELVEASAPKRTRTPKKFEASKKEPRTTRRKKSNSKSPAKQSRRKK